MGVTWRDGSSAGIGGSSAKVRQKVSALDRPGEMKFGG